MIHHHHPSPSSKVVNIQRANPEILSTIFDEKDEVLPTAASNLNGHHNHYTTYSLFTRRMVGFYSCTTSGSREKKESTTHATTGAFIHSLLRTKLLILQKNPTLFQELRKRLGSGRIRWSRHGQALEIHEMLNELKIVDVREEIKAHWLVVDSDEEEETAAKVPSKTSRMFFGSSSGRIRNEKKRCHRPRPLELNHVVVMDDSTTPSSSRGNESTCQVRRRGSSCAPGTLECGSSSSSSSCSESSFLWRRRTGHQALVSPLPHKLKHNQNINNSNVLSINCSKTDGNHHNESPTVLFSPSVHKQFNRSKKEYSLFNVEDYVGSTCSESLEDELDDYIY